MPTYDYVCDACGHAFEEFQSMKDDALKTCPKCKKKKLRRLIGTGAAVIFKGSGFYQTDYRSESYNAAAKADQDASKPAAEKTDTTGTTSTPKPETSAKPAKTGKKSSKSET